MQLNRSLLDAASARGLITAEQAEGLWDFLNEATQDQPSFRATHILYYFGGFIAIGAMTLFMTLGWERFGGWGLFVIALGYSAAGLWLTDYFLRRKYAIPAGIMAAFAVALVPLAVYGLQAALGYWADDRPYRDYHLYIDWRWILMELATLAVGVAVLWRYRLPFAVMPIAVTLWYMSMDLTPFLLGAEDHDWHMRKVVSVCVGIVMIGMAFIVDMRSRGKKDFVFWLYLFGIIAFWGGLTMMDSGSELNKFFYLCINLGMIAIGAALSRRVFVVFGGLGAALYLGHLAHDVFKESMLFP
ncbi:MAG TPA: DUF2157 domain-containing protein, partial [Burkholderiales bacterium]|nr:DUF2157 domain-containing protein [Burkholderiales bacterium]